MPLNECLHWCREGNLDRIIRDQTPTLPVEPWHVIYSSILVSWGLSTTQTSSSHPSPLLNFLRTTSDKCNETEYRVICTHSSGSKRKIPSRFSFFLGKCFFFFPETWQPSDLDGFFSKILWIVMKLSLSKYYLVVYKMLSKLHLISSLRNHLVFWNNVFKNKLWKNERSLNG